MGHKVEVLGMTRKWPRRWRIFHVPHGIAYAIENSPFGLAMANLLLFRWIDWDCHITRDGVPVVGHWGKLLRDHYILPDWFIAKYGRNPSVSDVDWPDLQRLVTRVLTWRGRHYRVRYMSVARAFSIAAKTKRVGVALEVKADAAFEHPAAFAAIEKARVAANLPADRLVVMTLQDIGRPLRRMKAAKASGRRTILLARGTKPAHWATEWAPHVDFVRGSWTRS